MIFTITVISARAMCNRSALRDIESSDMHDRETILTQCRPNTRESGKLISRSRRPTSCLKCAHVLSSDSMMSTSTLGSRLPCHFTHIKFKSTRAGSEALNPFGTSLSKLKAQKQLYDNTAKPHTITYWKTNLRPESL